jgi:hypothetical protein
MTSKPEVNDTLTPGAESDEPHSEHPALYRHALRDAWGHAVLVWDRQDKRAFQFEDGQLRIFNEGFYHLIQEVDLPLDQARPVLAALDRILGRRVAARRQGLKREQLLSFDDQLTLFRLQFPEGFQGPNWSRKVRGEGGGKALKRHRAPVIEAARQKLSAERLQKLLDAGKPGAVLDTVLKVLGCTSLVRPATVNKLRELDPGNRRAFAEALYQLLHGDGEHLLRLRDFLATLPDVGWQLATALPALVDPQNQVCVVPARFRQQALWMMPSMQHSDRPQAGVYLRYLKMARAVRDRLEQAGLHPRDLMDVHDFICHTLQPSARKLLKQDEAEQAAA